MAYNLRQEHLLPKAEGGEEWWALACHFVDVESTIASHQLSGEKGPRLQVA